MFYRQMPPPRQHDLNCWREALLDSEDSMLIDIYKGKTDGGLSFSMHQEEMRHFISTGRNEI